MEVIAIDHRARAQHEPTVEHLRECSHIALKGHVLVDQVLGRIISHQCRAAYALEGVEINFYVKARLARALVGDSHGTAVWDLVWRLYLIRTEIVHTLESPGVKGPIREFIAMESQWAHKSMPTIPEDDQLASSFADSIQSLLDVLAAIERRG